MPQAPDPPYTPSPPPPPNWAALVASLVAKTGGRSILRKPGKTPQKPTKPRQIPYPKNPNAPWGQSLLEQEANRRLEAQAGPLEAASKQRTQADLAALAGAGKAAADILAGEAPRIQDVYGQAAAEMGGLAGGYTGQIRDAAAADAAKAAEFSKLQGTPGAGPAPDVTNALYHGAAGIPGSSLISQGATARTLAEEQPGLAAMRTREDIRSRLGQGEQELIDLAAKRPEMRAQIMDELYKREQDKMDLRLKQQQVGIQQQAQDLYAKQFGETARHHVAGEKAANARLAQKTKNDLRNYNLKVKQHKQAMDQAAAEGRQPNASLSGKYGYIVDSNGDPIFDKHGNKIPVRTSKGASKGAGGLTPAQQNTNRRMAGEAASSMYDDSQPGPGQYGLPGTPPKHKWTFPAAQSYLMSTYGISRATARQLLISAGFKPTGKPRKGRGPGGTGPR